MIDFDVKSKISKIKRANSEVLFESQSIEESDHNERRIFQENQFMPSRTKRGEIFASESV